MNNDPLGLGGFNSQALHSPAGPAVKASAPKQGLIGRIGSSLIQAPKYFANADIVDPIKQLAATATHNKVALANANTKGNEDLGLGAKGTNIGQGIKTLAGNTAQIAGTFVAPAEAGMLSKAIAGARGGALIGGGSALSNNQNVLKGALEGAVGGAALAPAIPLAGKALGIGGKVVNAAATGRVGSADVAGEASNLAPKPTIGQKLTSGLINKGEEENARLGGFATGQKIAGKQLTPADSSRISQTLNDEGISALSAPDKATQVGEKIDSLNNARSSLIEANNTPLTDEDKTALTQAVNDRLSKEAGGSRATVQDHAGTFLSEANESPDVAALGKYKTSLDNNAINYAKNPASVEPGQAIAAKAVRGAIKDMVEAKVPGIGDINARATALQSAQGGLLNASGRLANLTTGGEGIWGRILSGGEAEKAKAAIANTAIKAGTKLQGVTGTPPEPILGDINAPTETPGTIATPPAKATGATSSILGSLTGGTNVARLGVAGALGNPPQSTPQPALSASDITNGITPAQAPTQQSESEDSPYPEENMLYDIERDPKNASTYEGLYNLLNPKPSASATSLDATQQKEVAAGESAINRLQQYGQQLDAATGGNSSGTGGLYAALGRDLPGFLTTSGQKQAAALQSGRRDVAIQLATALSGGTKPSAQSVDEIENSLPSVTDSSQARSDKINALVSGLKLNLQTYATPVSQLAGSITGQQTNNGTVGSNLDSILGSLTGAQ